jgi:hypothetical protein
MSIEYRIKFENGVLTITPAGDAGTSPAKPQQSTSSLVVSSHQISRPLSSGQGGGSNPPTGPGGNPPDPGSNPPTGPGGNPPDPGSNPPTGPGGRVLPTAPPYVGTSFTMETQQESEWCWAAVSASVDHYFQPGSYSTQCAIASQVIPGDACAQPDVYDEPEQLQDALDVVGRLRGVTWPLTFEQLQAEINANRPVCIRIAWDQGGAHFVALTGYQVLSSGVRTVDVADPFYAASTEDFDMFPAYYHGGGTWTASFLTN